MVLSTTWRLDAKAHGALLDACQGAGIDGERFIGCTPEIRQWGLQGAEGAAAVRVLETVRWLQAHAEECEVGGWVALDDLPLADGAQEAGHGQVAPQMVRTNPELGLQDDDVERALAILELQPCAGAVDAGHAQAAPLRAERIQMLSASVERALAIVAAAPRDGEATVPSEKQGRWVALDDLSKVEIVQVPYWKFVSYLMGMCKYYIRNLSIV